MGNSFASYPLEKIFSRGLFDEVKIIRSFFVFWITSPGGDFSILKHELTHLKPDEVIKKSGADAAKTKK
jgi:hypothetical protein